MSGNPPKSPGSKTTKRNSRTVPGGPAGSELPETTANSRDIEISELSFKQQSALPVIAVSGTVAQASRDSGVSEKTLRKWLDDPSFRAELDRLRQESYDLARKQLQALMPHCLAIFAELAEQADDPAIRLRAARYLMSYAVKFRDLDKLADDLRDLRAIVLENK